MFVARLGRLCLFRWFGRKQCSVALTMHEQEHALALRLSTTTTSSSMLGAGRDNKLPGVGGRARRSAWLPHRLTG